LTPITAWIIALQLCAPTDEKRLIVVVCIRPEPTGRWIIFGARDATAEERVMWKVHDMSDSRPDLSRMSPQEAAAYVMNNDTSEYFEGGEVVSERRPAKMVTALRIDLGIQAELEAAAAARGTGSSTLMRQIIEEWVEAHRDAAPDHLVELVRHLDAARRAASSLAHQAA
jgi:predicted DNA-binding protein